MKFPLDILNGDVSNLIERASKSDGEISKWKEDIIGEQFDPGKFVSVIESYLPTAKYVYSRDKVIRPIEPRYIQREAEPCVKKVLVYCPLYATEPKIHPFTLKSIQNLQWDYPFDVVYGESDHEHLLEGDNKRFELAMKYNKAREMVLNGDYDALLTVEADMIIPPDALKKLACVDSHVIYGLYVSRYNLQWFLYLEGPERGKQISRDKRLRRRIWGKIVESVGIGNGCTLIHRNVLERIAFEASTGVAPDWNFAHACKRHDFKQAHDCSVVCGHINGKEIVWPDPQFRYRIEQMKQKR
jgi:hypothetical protein